jgi:threonine dehydrogenase-like Zn-dependent dehydrogenase
MDHPENNPIPETNPAWNLYGSGYDNLGRLGIPENIPVSQPNSEQLLVRIDCVGICYSDVKLLQQGENHPKLKDRNLSKHPTRPGHEVSFTVIKVGDSLKDKFQAGERYVVQPEVVHHNKNFTYGFSLPGGLTQYQLIGPELLCTDDGVSIMKIDDSLGYAEACLLEPWGSVLSTYENTRRLVPKLGGKMWIVGNPEIQTERKFSDYLDRPESILISDLPVSLEEIIIKSNLNVRIQDGISVNQYINSIDRTVPPEKFDDIVVVDPISAEQIEILISMIKIGGLINLIGNMPLNEPIRLDPQRIHYDFISIIGNSGPDLAESYGTDRNPSSLSPKGAAVFYGAGGAMGQIHVENAIAAIDGPDKIVVIDINQERLDHIENRFARLAQQQKKSFHTVNPLSAPKDLNDHIKDLIDQEYVDDMVVLVPDAAVFERAASLLGNDSLLNMFAGTPAGASFPIDISNVYLGNLQITGSSGLRFRHIIAAHELAISGNINIGAAVVALGGMGAALEAIRAVEEGRFPGKIVIYPHLVDLPLTSIEDLCKHHPEISRVIGEKNLWSKKAEEILMKSQ